MRVKRVVVTVAIIVCSAGIAMGQTEWSQHPDNPIIGPGPPGSWDASGHWIGSVVLVGSTYHMWFSGVDQGGGVRDIGHATSLDAVDWTMDPANPVLTGGAPGDWDGVYMIQPQVIHDGMQFHMWYTGSDGTNERGGYATSPDGTTWTKHPDNPVIDVGPPGSWDDGGVRPGTVVLDGETYKMWYHGHRDDLRPRIGYAESMDGVNWTKRPDPVLDWPDDPSAWDWSLGNPSVVFNGSAYHMFYTGHGGVGYGFSSDGIEWTRHPDNPVIVESPGEMLYSFSVIFEDSYWRIWHSHWDGAIDWISYATSICCTGIFGDDFETGDTSLWSVTVP